MWVAVKDGVGQLQSEPALRSGVLLEQQTYLMNLPTAAGRVFGRSLHDTVRTLATCDVPRADVRRATCRVRRPTSGWNRECRRATWLWSTFTL
jgi:hypothetical protein